jgi:hypothetical protein
MAGGRQGTVIRLAAMTGRRTPLAALAAATVAVAVSGCGSGDDDSIPKSASDQLIAQLNEMEGYVNDGDCELAQGQATQFEDSVQGLPSEVDSEVKGDLTKLADNLVELADSDECAAPEEGATGPSGATTTEPEGEPTTESSTTTTTTTEEPAEEQPPGNQDQQSPPGQSENSQGTPSAENNGAGISGGGSGGLVTPKPKGRAR